MICNIIDKTILKMDAIYRSIVIWHLVRYKYHVDLRYNGKDVLTEIPVKISIRKSKNGSPISINFELNNDLDIDDSHIANELILFREPKFLYFGKFTPVIIKSMDTAHKVSEFSDLVIHFRY